ncbi:Mevalonate kinase [Trachymyrmex septentrionalis]|uniref:Mevalonate kinase n=1 Tax=Trachymyrmex septentrionalis TaxID=34720 RepID=A0A195FL13_9HYME|nr:PREDICTED: mevalonate kinase-like [Trachymyrmex septentrionalis]KYN40679.1 Mevalonate kinase [Trachymyrmex septentrionalis]
MYRFNVSAPGTVILCGKCKKSCVAASLDMRTVLTFSSFPTEAVQKDFIEIKFSSIRLHMKIPLRIFLLHFFKKNYNRTLNPLQVLQSVQNFIKFLTGFPGNYDPDNRAHQLSLQAFFFLLVTISYHKNIIINSSFVVELSSELPIGEGLGSSTSFIVCLAACFFRWYLLQKGKVRYIFKSKDLVHIEKYAHICEKIVYNSSNIINVIISAYGMIQVVKKKKLLKKLNYFSDLPSMKILLVFSHVSQEIEQMEVEMKVSMTEYLSSSVDVILNSIKTIRKKLIQTFKEIKRETLSLKQQEVVETDSVRLINYYKNLIDLFHMNQGLLKALGTSHPNIDAICSIARNSSLGAKITAIRAGGYVFILLLPSNSDEYIQDLIKIFVSHNFPTKIASLNCSGVRVE